MRKGINNMAQKVIYPPFIFLEMLIQLCGLPHVYFSISQRMHALNNLFILNSMFQHITLLHEKIFRILQFKCCTTHTKHLQGPKQALVDGLWLL